MRNFHKKPLKNLPNYIKFMFAFVLLIGQIKFTLRDDKKQRKNTKTSCLSYREIHVRVFDTSF